MIATAPPLEEIARGLASDDPAAQRDAAQDAGRHGLAGLAPQLPALLTSTHAGVQQAALDAMVALDYCPPAAMLAELMVHPSPPVRSATIELIERLGRRCGTEIAHLARHPNTDVRVAIAQLLGRVAVPAADLLATLMDDADVNVRVMAAESAAATQDLSAVPALLGHLADEPWVACTVVTALGQLGVTDVAPQIDDALRRALDAGDVAMAQACIDALCRLGDAVYLRVLLGRMLLARPEQMPVFREALAGGVAFLQLWPILREIESELVELACVNDPPPGADLADFGRLGDHLSAPAAWKLLRFAAQIEASDDDADRGRQRRESLLTALSRTCPLHVLTEAAAHADDAIAQTALAAMTRRDWLHVGQVLQGVAEAASPERRVAILQTIGHMRDASAIPLVDRLLDDASGHVRAAAAAAAGVLGCEHLRGRLREMILSDYPDVVTAAAGALAQLGDGSAVLAELMPSLPANRRQCILEVLSDPRNQGEHGGMILTSCLHDADPAVRTRAAEILLSRPDDPEVAGEVAQAMLIDSDASLRRAAARAMRPEIARTIEATIECLVETTEDPWERYELIRLCQRCGLRRCEGAITKQLSADHMAVRIAAVEALGALGCTDAMAGIAALADSEDPALAQAATAALNAITGGAA